MTLVLMFFMYAFLGWLLEVTFYFFKHHRFVNRGVIIGPFVPIYGLSALTLHVLVYRVFDTNVEAFSILQTMIVFVLIGFVTAALELIGGSLLYRFFNARWWDYSSERFNYKGFVSLKYSLIWGGMGTLLFSFFHTPFMYPFLTGLPLSSKRIATYVLGAYFLIDSTLTLFMLFDFKTRIVVIKTRLETLLINTERYMESTKPTQINNARQALRSALYALKNNRPMDEVKTRLEVLKRYLVIGPDNKAKQEYGKIKSIVIKLSTSHLTKAFPNLKIDLKDSTKKDRNTDQKKDDVDE
jgi:uncharacterized membrane protein